VKRLLGSFGETRNAAAAAAAAAAILILALSDGGYGTAVYSAAAAGAWLAVVALLLFAPAARIAAPPLGLVAVAALLALAALTFLSVSWAPDGGAAYLDAVRTLGYAGALALVLLAVRAGSAPALLIGVAVAGATVAAVALGAAVLGVAAADELVAALPSSGGRLAWPIGYWNGLGALLALSLAPLLWSAGAAPRPRRAALAALPLPLIVSVLYLTGSRGALVAAALAAVVVLLTAARRDRVAVAAGAGVAGAAPAIAIAAAAGTDSLERSLAGVAVAAAALAGCAVAFALVDHWGDRWRELRVDLHSPRVRIAIGVAALVVFAGCAAALLQLFGDAAARPAIEPSPLASDSGRGEYWRAALDAAREEPLRGIGAGAYGDFWNRNGSLDVPSGNPHSLPLETLAELGLLGILPLAVLVLAVLAAFALAVRDPARRPIAGASGGILAAVAFGCLIDWTWELPAVIVPALIATGLITLLAQPVPRRGAGMIPLRLGGAALAAAAVAVALVATGFAARLDTASEQLDRGDVEAAAREARAAAELLPIDPRPHIILAEAEQAAGNLEAARREAEAAARLGPQSYRPWLLLGSIHLSSGNTETSLAYAQRAFLAGGEALVRAQQIGGLPGAPIDSWPNADPPR
jgi:hypothetical protein